MHPLASGHLANQIFYREREPMGRWLTVFVAAVFYAPPALAIVYLDIRMIIEAWPILIS